MSSNADGDRGQPSVQPSLRILLAEDNAVTRLVATALLEKWGHRVVAVNDGREAVAAVQSQPFDVVLMDLQMPEMDGWEATSHIRRLEGDAAGLAIIAVTAHSDDGDRQRCLDHGMNGYIGKPFNLAGFQEVLQVVKGRGHS